MKKFFKWILILFAAIVVLGIIGASCGGSATAPATTQATPAKKSPAAKVTKSNYTKIKIGDTLTGKGGMTIAQVKAILGKPMDHTTSESSIEGQKTTLDIYDWSEGFTKTITVDFTNGHASGKTQVGLDD